MKGPLFFDLLEYLALVLIIFKSCILIFQHLKCIHILRFLTIPSIYTLFLGNQLIHYNSCKNKPHITNYKSIHLLKSKKFLL